MSSSHPLPRIGSSSEQPSSRHVQGRGAGPFLVRVARALHRRDDGAATAEYAVATMAAVGFAGLLVVILRSDEVRAILTELVRNALTFTG